MVHCIVYGITTRRKSIHDRYWHNHHRSNYVDSTRSGISWIHRCETTGRESWLYMSVQYIQECTLVIHFVCTSVQGSVGKSDRVYLYPILRWRSLQFTRLLGQLSLLLIVEWGSGMLWGLILLRALRKVNSSQRSGNMETKLTFEALNCGWHLTGKTSEKQAVCGGNSLETEAELVARQGSLHESGRCGGCL